MKYAVASDIRQSIMTGRFFLGVLFVAAVVFLSSMDGVLEAFRSDKLLAYGFHGDFVLKTLEADAIIICLPIVCALPFAGSYVDDVKTGFLKLYIHRTSHRGYILGKAAGCLVSGGLVIVLGLWLAYGVSILLFLPMEAAPTEGAEPVNHAIELFRSCGLIFLSGGFWALFGMTMSAFMESRYIAYAAPFIFYYILIILCERYFSSLYVVYPKAWLLPGEEWSLGRWGPALVVMELIVVTVLCFGVAVRKRVRGL